MFSDGFDGFGEPWKINCDSYDGIRRYWTVQDGLEAISTELPYL